MAFVHEDNEETLKYFKKNVHPDHFNSAKRTAKLTDYETCLKLVAAVENRNEINKYVNDIQAIAEIASFDFIKKTTITKKIFKALMKLVGETYLVADFKKITEVQLPNKLKVTQKDVKEALKLFHNLPSRRNKERLTAIEPLTIELVATVRHEIDAEIVKRSILKYISMRTPQQQKVLMKSVERLGLK